MFRLLVSIIVIVASVVVISTVISPQYNELEALRDRRVQLASVWENAQQIKALRDDLDAQYQSYSPSDLARLEAFLPDTIDNVGLLLDIQTLAQQSGMTVVSANVARTAEDNNTDSGQFDPVGTVDMQFNLIGSYIQFTEFLEKVETSLRLVDMTALNVSPLNELDDAYEFTFSLDAYWLRPQPVQ